MLFSVILLLESEHFFKVVMFHKRYMAAESKNKFYVKTKECIEAEKAPKDIIIELKNSMTKNDISIEDALLMIWNCIIHAIEWNTDGKI